MNFNQPQQYPQYYTQPQYFNPSYYTNIPFNYSQLNYYQKLQLLQNQYQYQGMLRQSSYYYFMNQHNLNNTNNVSSSQFQGQGAINPQQSELNIEHLNELAEKKIEQKKFLNFLNIGQKNSVEVQDSKVQKISVINNQISNTKSKEISLKSSERKKNRNQLESEYRRKISANKDSKQIDQQPQQKIKYNTSSKFKNRKVIQKFHKKFNNIYHNQNQLTQFQIDLQEKNQPLVIKIKRIKKQKTNQIHHKTSNKFSVYKSNHIFPKIHIRKSHQSNICQDYYFNNQQYRIKECEKIQCLKQRLVSQNPKFYQQLFEKISHFEPIVLYNYIKHNIQILNQGNIQKVIDQVSVEAQKYKQRQLIQ